MTREQCTWIGISGAIVLILLGSLIWQENSRCAVQCPVPCSERLAP